MATFSVDSNFRRKLFTIPINMSVMPNITNVLSSNIVMNNIQSINTIQPVNVQDITITPALTNSSIATVANVISTKPQLITRTELRNLGRDIKLVGYDPIVGLVSNSNKTFSSKIINWVEPYEIRGSVKTLFYTEVNSELKVGDRVFIINGTYDNDLLIKNDKYKKGRDGYKILYIDKCRVVLDIDYVGTLPYSTATDDDFIRVYYIRNESEFLHANRQITTRGGKIDYKFNYYQNNIAFIDNNYLSSQDWGLNTGVSNAPGFFVKSPTASWTNISNQFITGSYSLSLSPTYTNINRVKIMNSDFTYNGKEFKEGYIYKWVVGPTQSSWEVDVTYFDPYLTKSNFRDGNFNGEWNSGLYGQYEKRIKWQGNGSVWNIGTLINTIWEKGDMNSLYTASQSYFSSFDDNGLPYQKVNSPNNSDRGYNFISNSVIESSTIKNGSFYTTRFGTQSGSTYSIVENEILGVDSPYPNKVEKAFFNDCEFNNSYLENSELKNTKSNNSKFEKSKSINSYFNNSVLKDSFYNSDNIIKIYAYDEFTASENPQNISVTFSSIADEVQKVYKFYIDKNGYDRLRTGDKFYIKGLVISNFSKDVINFFDKKFKIGSWTEYIEDGFGTTTSGKRGFECSSFLSTPLDNSYKFESSTAIFPPLTGLKHYTEINGVNPNSKYYSIDIWFKRYDKIGLTFSTTISSLSFNNIIDVSSAYIVDSDFDSGLIENSDWNSGSHIESNNDNDITVQTLEGGLYNLSIDSSNFITATTSYDSSYPEDSLINVGEVVFLDSVDFQPPMPIIATGSSILPDTQVGFSMIFTFTQSYDNILITGSSSTTSTDGTFDLFYESGTYPSSSLIDNLLGKYMNFNTTYNFNIPLSGVSASNSIRFYINDGAVDNLSFQILNLDNNSTRIPDAYKVITNTNGVYQLKEVGTVSQIISLSASNGYYYTENAENRYGYLRKLKISKSNIKSGFLRRSYLSGSLVQDLEYNYLDKDFSNLPKIKNLVISDSIFSNNSNILSNATYLNSFFVEGSDIWNSGIIQNSIWNGGTFSNGVIRDSRWLKGKFLNGWFYNSRTFDGIATVSNPYYYSENINSYYRKGTLPNNRNSWQDGEFIDGQFFKSDWESGTFSNGDFYYSKWYDGTFIKGNIGSNEISTVDTHFYNGTVSYATVKNATLYSIDTSFGKTQSQNINWLNGIFINGVFGSDITQSATATHSSTWYDGIFNGGQFVTNGKWKNGTFNGGKFISAYGWSQSESLSVLDYGWENGKFNGGEFGNANGLTNSTWYTGEFNDGVFKGRVWNDGIFLYGEFQGSGSSPVSGLTSGNANIFVDSYTSSYWGKWRNGLFTNTKDKFVKDQKFFTKSVKAMSLEGISKPIRLGKFKNGLWENGTFSHPSGEMISSVWLDGAFERGKFIGSSFNPYVKRNGSATQSFNLNDETCYWENGSLENSDFYISRWKNGNFIIGTGIGMIWENGISNYMNAFNIFWEGGLWRNGNWYGSSFEFDGLIDEDYTLQILYRGMSWSGTSSTHIWNIFEIPTSESNVIVATASALGTTWVSSSFSPDSFALDIPLVGLLLPG